MGAFGPGPSREFRCGSCCGSHFSWGCSICKQLPGGVDTHSKTLQRNPDQDSENERSQRGKCIRQTIQDSTFREIMA